MIDRLTGRGHGCVAAYGDLVDILAARGELRCAAQLEELWNGLVAQYPLTLLCGHTSGHFGDPQTAMALRDICDAHDHATASPHDLLGSWLIARTSRYPLSGSFLPSV